MKRLMSILLALVLLTGVCAAEEQREFTAEEQAYDVYLDIHYAYSGAVEYMAEFYSLWGLVLDVDSVEDMDQYWFDTQYLLGVNSGSDESFQRYMMLNSLAAEKYGLDSNKDLYDAFMALVKTYGNNPKGIVGAGMALAEESNLVLSEAEIRAHLDDAMAGIRALMAIDREYPFLGDLQAYYKEAVLVSEYLASSNANYSEFGAQVSAYTGQMRSWEIDFEFIFDPAGYPYVNEVRGAEMDAELKAIYDRAAALEAKGDYAGAIDLYWECGYYGDARERIVVCRDTNVEMAKEAIYSDAVLKHEASDYMGAIEGYVKVLDYKDSAERYVECVNHTKVAQVMSKKHVCHYEAYEMPAGTAENEVFTRDENGNLLKAERSGIRYGYAFTETRSYHYDDSGVLSSITQVYVTEGAETVYEMLCDEYGNVVESVRVSYNGDTSKQLTTYYTYEYDAHGNIVTETSNMGPDSMSTIKTYVYTFDEQGRKTKVEAFQESVIMEKRLAQTVEYSYSIYGTIEKETVTNIAMDSTRNQSEILYSY